MTAAISERRRAEIPEEHRVSEYGNAVYGRPRFRLHFYSQRINAPAFKTFSTRHEAVGVLAVLDREGVTEHETREPHIEYQDSY